MIAVSGRDPERTEAAPGIRWRTLAAVCATAAGAAVILLYFASAARLLAYPWDWSPNEGLVLDYARRLLRDPLSLYPRGTVVPSPDYYGPVTPLLLAPVTAGFANPWPWSRLLALGWSAAIGAGVYALVRQRAGRPLSLLSAALAFAPLGLSCFYMVIRADGPMIALWLWAAYLLLPREADVGGERLGRGGQALGRGRELGGAALLVASVLCKPTAVLHGAPVVLAWLGVNRRQALRLAVVVGALGLGALLILQLLTGGGYLAVMRLWRIHQTVRGQWWTILAWYFRWTWPVAALAVGGLAFAVRAGGGRWKDPALALWVGGALLVPGLRKGGASFNYLLPWLCATVVLAGRYWSARPRPTLTRTAPDGEAIGALAGTVVALLLVQTQTFPLPTAADAATARAFYGFIAGVVRQQGGPILATTPDYAYYQVGQPVEVEGSSLPYLVAAQVPGVDTILRRLQTRSYTVVASTASYWPWDPAYTEAITRGYRPVAVCSPGFFFGHPHPFVLHVPRESAAAFVAAPLARCQAYAAPDVAAR